MDFSKSDVLRGKSHRLIPGGAHTYAKGDDQFPERSPGFIDHGHGCHVWDVDGNEFIEYGMGLRSVTLGHGFPPVVAAATRAMQMGLNFTRPQKIEVDCAERLLGLLPGADMVKFGKNGSDATSAAVKLARAFTGRDMVAVCKDQPFFSVDDWFIGSTPMAAGIPQLIRNLTLKFSYSDPGSLEELFSANPGQIACIIMEAEAYAPTTHDHLQSIINICHRHGAVFILDEILTGFRCHLGGAQAMYGITPDLSAFGKALGNGFSISALAGKREIMKLGGLQESREKVFLMSTTYGAESIGLAAAIETIGIYEEKDVVGFLWLQGKKLRKAINEKIDENHLTGYFEVIGQPYNMIYATRDSEKKPSQRFRTLFLQETIKRGLLMPSLVISFSHSDEDIERTVDAIGGALSVYARALNEGVDKYLEGRPVVPVFRKYD